MLTPTDEQLAILAAAATGKSGAVLAVAGAGKTSTLRMIADANPHKRILYFAYNKKAQLEAAATFPPHVDCRTGHSLGHEWVRSQPWGQSFLRKLTMQASRSSAKDARELGIWGDHLGLDPAEVAGLAVATVAKFQNSDSQTIEGWMVPAVEGLDEGDMAQMRDIVVGYAREVWRNYMNPRGALKPSHDTYVKMWARKRPVLGYDLVLYDEAQDADPCIAGIVENSRRAGKQVIAVGDSSQAIYGWRGATDFLETFDADWRLALTQSWRFGQTVADEANVWLSVIGASEKVTGNPDRESTLKALEDDDTDAVLCRTNAGTIENLIAAHESGRKVHLVGDGREMLSFAKAAAKLQAGERVRHPDLMAFKSWEDVVEYVASDKGGADLALFVRMIESYGTQGVIDAIEQAVPEKEYLAARERGESVLVVSTAHKSKGLEWDRVRIGNDFKLPVDKETGKPKPIPKTDAMLAYVAITRCRTALDAGPLGGIHDHLAALAAG